jgi:predicted lysophospholipase L1 biosynthesis ABC-type transport system permease subunit
VRGLFAPAQTFFSTGKTRSQTHAAIRHQMASVPSQKRADVIQSFGILAGGFAIATGIFLLAITHMAGMLDIELTRRALGPSLLTLSACLLGSLAVDVVLIGQVEQIQAEAWVQQSLGRVFLIYLAVFIGVFLALFFQAVWFVTPFIVLKAIVDIGGPVQRMVKRFGQQ